MLKWVLLTSWVSPHQKPLAENVVAQLGDDNFRYWYLEQPPENHKIWGWDKLIKEDWFYLGNLIDRELIDCENLISGNREIELFEKRSQQRHNTHYMSERWFKPPLGFARVFVPLYFKMAWRFVKCLKCDTFKYLPMGIHAARDMARLVGFLSGEVRCLFVAPKVAFESCPGGAIVPLKEAIKAGVLSADEITFGKKHGFVQIPREQWGKVEPQKVYAKMRMWGYFVVPSKVSTEDTERDLTTNCTNLHEGVVEPQDCQSLRSLTRQVRPIELSVPHTDYHPIADLRYCQCGEKPQKTQKTQKTQKDGCAAGHACDFENHEIHEKGANAQTGNRPLATGNCREGASRLRVLWVGRMLKLKRVDTLVKACASNVLKEKVELHLYGHGPEEEKLKRLAKESPQIYFHDYVPVEQVRELMRAHDVYVFSSNASDGWGAVVSEALEEGMQVFGTIEAGASGTVLPPTHLFKAGDVKCLTELLMAELPKVSIGEWTAESGANWLTTK